MLITLSICLTPAALFNQQIITGLSLQPVHYELFIANYLALLSIVLFAAVIFRDRLTTPTVKKVLVYVALASVVWGFIESTATASRNAAVEKLRDDSMPGLRYLSTMETDTEKNNENTAVLSTDLAVAEYVPTVTTFRPLWNPHTNSAGGVSRDENTELFYKYLYFSGFDDQDLAKAIDANMFEVISSLFGGGRALPKLSGESKPITAAEVSAEIKKYRDYTANFDADRASFPKLTYIIVPAKAEPNFANLDRWYLRDAGREFGEFKVYELSPKF